MTDDYTEVSCQLPRPRPSVFAGPRLVSILIVVLVLSILVTTGVLYFWGPW